MDLPFRYVRFGCAMNIESGLSVREIRSLYTTLSVVALLSLGLFLRFKYICLLWPV